MNMCSASSCVYLFSTCIVVFRHATRTASRDMIVVTAPTGKIGHQVLEHVLGSGEPVQGDLARPSTPPLANARALRLCRDRTAILMSLPGTSESSSRSTSAIGRARADAGAACMRSSRHGLVHEDGQQ